MVATAIAIFQAGKILLMILFLVYHLISDQVIIKQESGRGLRAYCPTQGSFVPTDDVSFTKDDIQYHSLDEINEVKDFTTSSNAELMSRDPGSEHYRLLSYLTKKYGDCRHVVDIGTGAVTSALALGASGISVWSFELPDGQEMMEAFRGSDEKVWQRRVKRAGVDITFYNVDLLECSDEFFLKYMSTWIIQLGCVS